MSGREVDLTSAKQNIVWLVKVRARLQSSPEHNHDGNVIPLFLILAVRLF